MQPKKLALCLLFVLGLGVFGLRLFGASTPRHQPVVQAKPATAIKINQCQNNSGAKAVYVSINQRHLWACQGTQTVYDAPVVTGDTNIPANLTPPGTYKIYAKQTNRSLVGSDQKGSWDVHVNYWLPFLDNQYGTYGFHDATWRADKDFGNISPSSPDASHGCVELPLKASAWLYSWSEVGTTVKISS